MSRSANRSQHPLRPSFRRAAQAAVLAAGMCAPLAVTAQGQDSVRADSAGAKHQVRSGDTLWDLARTYLSDPYRWRAIYDINTDVVRDPHWIYPGETLRLPGGTSAYGPSVAEPTMPSSVEFDRSVGLDAAVRASAHRPVAGLVAARPVRAVEAYGAPWVDRRGGPSGRGELVALVAPSGTVEIDDHPRLQVQERVYAQLPPGSTASVGDRFLAVAFGDEVGDDGQLVIPTAIVRVEQIGKGRAATVRVVQLFDDARVGQALIPFQRLPIPEEGTRVSQTLGIGAHVISVPRAAVLPSLLHYVVLDARLKDGVAIGDQFTLFRDPPRDVENAGDYPEEPIALVQVMRVTDRGATAIVVDQRHPGIREGVRARLTAKMP
ncbi:MAG TPA: LysM peptidoglycan-binding domain-containing protein [Gemmatimonadaceae bacterium]|nr:LysM peptidoglycan-binding domain-containing protein [Gemmatimonadaceae bacterium]